MLYVVIGLSAVVLFLVFCVVPAAHVAGQRQALQRVRWHNRSRSAGHSFRVAPPPAGFGQVEDVSGRPVAPGATS